MVGEWRARVPEAAGVDVTVRWVGCWRLRPAMHTRDRQKREGNTRQAVRYFSVNYFQIFYAQFIQWFIDWPLAMLVGWLYGWHPQLWSRLDLDLPLHFVQTFRAPLGWIRHSQPSNFSSDATMRFTFVVLREISHQPLDGLSWNFLNTFKAP